MTVAADPLRSVLLEESTAEADRVLARADELAEAKLAEAEEQGRALVEQARREGLAAAAIVGAHEEAGARRRARAVVLGARRELYEELGRRARVEAHGLRRDPGYAALLDRLSAAARAQLGPEAVLEVDPPEAGGVRAASGARHVDYTLDALVDRALAGLGSGLERLWA